MNLQLRIDLLTKLGNYMESRSTEWEQAKGRASAENNWFIPEFIELSAQNIARSYLQKDYLKKWVNDYSKKIEPTGSKNIGIVMAGNIPMVGFHDLLSVFISGHFANIKLSSKDNVLIKHLGEKLIEWTGDNEIIRFSEMLKNCDAYIATGSNNSSRYFEYYFAKYPHIIRRNKTSVALLTGNETSEDLEKLADDVYQYFGLGCRNVTKIYVPRDYDFVPLLGAFKKYNYLSDHHKYKNNYDYNLALHLLNKKYYMTNGSILLVEDPSLFSPISQLNYEYFDDPGSPKTALESSPDLQSIIGKGFVPFGKGQCPAIDDYADKINVLDFLVNL
jgi:hypothetical protein